MKTTTIQLSFKKGEYLVNSEQVKDLRSYKNFICSTDDSHLLKKLNKKQASQIIKRLKTEEVIELKG